MVQANSIHRWLKIGPLLWGIIGLAMILGAFNFSPVFVANNLSSDGVLDHYTIVKINILRIELSVIATLVLVFSFLLLKRPRWINLIDAKLDISRIENSKVENYFVYTLITIIGFVFIANAYFSPRIGYGGDSLTHYFISRYSWKHPELLLSLWGKPFFTLISSIFSQFGWVGMVSFNISCALLTAYITYLYCKKVKLPISWFSVVLIAFTPIYFKHVPTGLTEPFFTFILVTSAYLYLKEKYISGSVLISFLPFIRSEGFLVLPLFFCVLILRRQFYKSPLLGVGLAIYSTIGYFYTNNILWVFAENYPYKGPQAHYYGSGSFFHFFKASPGIFSVSLLVLIVAGIIHLIFSLIRDRNKLAEDKAFIESLFIMTGSFLVYFFAHCIFWWLGIFASLGLSRPMAATTPGAVFTAIYGLNFLKELLIKVRIFNSALLITILGILIFNSAVFNYFLPGKLSDEQSLTVEASIWLKDNGYLENKIYFSNPILPFVLNLDPYDSKKIESIYFLDKESPAKNIPMHSIIVWDGHFSPNEGQLPLQNLTNSGGLKLLKSFIPEKPITVLNQYSYEIHVFIKQPENQF